ncbi:MAG TPA: DNA polymerase domain-containing protein [Chloroflexia bacterium]|nr:DNA polymerase domain-containing protein [Chloroflexia bacterium]
MTITPSGNATHKDEWLFGWDQTPGIVSVWADRTGKVLLWQRLPGQEKVSCQRGSYRPWLFATSLDDLAHLGSGLVEASLDKAFQENLPFSYQILAGPEGRSFCYLLSASNGQALEREILKGAQARLGKELTGLRDLDSDYYRVGPVEQYLMASGKAYFRGLAYSDLHRLQFDLETTSLDPRQGRIFMVAVHDSQGFSAVLEAPTPGDERELILKLCQLVRERDPDVIENHNLFGFDLPFLLERARALRVPLNMSRPEGPSALERYQEPQVYRRGKRMRFNLAGRELVDTLDAVLRHDFSARDMPGHGLKAAARYFGVAAPRRTYIPGSEVYATYRRDPERVRRYALDDVLEVDGLSQRLMGAPFALAVMAPRPYGRLTSAGPAMGILEPMLVRAYFRAGEALPCYPPDDRELGPHAGGATILYSAGVARQVVKADIASMYPSIMRTFQVGPRPDRLGVLLFLVSRLTDLRLGHKEALRSTSPGSPEAYRHLAMHSAMKILINSGYGYMGAGRMALFADRHAADEVTRRGREILGQVATALEDRGMRLLEADTDGIFFAVPGEWGEEQERRLVAEVAATLPPGLKLEYEGRYRAMLSHEVKNYALLTYDGRLISRGVAFHSSRSEPFGVKFLEKAVLYCLTGDIVMLRELYLETVAALLNQKLPSREVATVARLAKTPAEYMKKRRRQRETSYEALLAAGRRDWQVGERVRFYQGAGGLPVLLTEEEEDAPAEEELDQEALEDAFEEPTLAEAIPQSSEKSEATESSLAPWEGPGLNKSALPQYDAGHYLRVLHTSYISRLRKAFKPEDFEQLFRVNGQLGLFDRPVGQIEPEWLN